MFVADSIPRPSSVKHGFIPIWLVISAYLAVALIPLQVFGLNVYNTRVDISTMAFIAAIPFLLKRRAVYIILTIFAGLCVLALLFQYILSFQVPFSRVFASAGWLSLLISFLLVPTRVNNLVIRFFALGLRTSFVIFVIGYFAYPFSGNEFGTFNESSYASLYLSAFVLSELLPFFLIKAKDYPSRLFVPIAAIFIVINPTSHLLTLLISALATYLFAYNPRIVKQLIRFNPSAKTIVSLLLLVLFLFATLSFALSSERVYTRIASLFPEIFRGSGQAANLSSLVWQGGASQLFQSMRDCPILGCGAGSTGLFSELSIPSLINAYFPQSFIPSYYENILFSLNSLDAYSLLFRTVIEYGLIVFPLWILLVRRILKSMRICIVSPSYSIQPSLGVLVFSFTCLTGSLLKEPHLFASVTFVPIMISAIVSLKIATSPSHT